MATAKLSVPLALSTLVITMLVMLMAVPACADGVFFTSASAGVSGGASDSSINPNQYSFSSRGSTSAGVNGSVSGVFTVGEDTDAGPTFFSFFSSGESTASASAAIGVLRAAAQAGATSTPQSYTFSSGGETASVFNPGGGQGVASAGAEFADTLTIVGSSEVTLRFSFAVDGGVSASPPTLPNGFPAASLSSTMDVAGETIRQGSPGTLSLDGLFLPGDQVFISATLSASADAATAGSVAAATAAANGGDTGRFFVDVLSPGGGYVSASGTIYPAGPTNVVPEPASLTLLGSGLLAVVGYVRRRRLA